MKRLSLCLLFFCLYSVCIGQHVDNVQISLPSPNNKDALSDKNISVNYYRGTPNINLPLYTLESSELSIPISLSYDATGVKLHDYSSSVGINWGLKAGGAVTRIVRGLPDESDNGYSGKNKTGVHINGTLIIDAIRGDKIASGEWDGEPDLFIITTPFESVSFIFDQDKNPVFTSPTKMKVSMSTPTGPSDYVNVSWTAVDGKGNQYKFGTTSSSREVVQGSINFVSTWYLDEVKNFNGTDVVSFEYTSGPQISTNRYTKVKVFFTYTGAVSGGPPEIVQEYPTTVVYNSPKYLSKISCSSGNVSFTYAGDRQDLMNAYRLTSLNISNKYNVIKNIKFRHNYFNIPDVDKDLNRLCLQDIYLQSGNGLTSMKLFGFSYFNNIANKFPHRNSVAFDHWGYYNNNTSATPYPPDAVKSPDLEKTKQYTLKEIEYGLGGKTLFNYQLNSYFDNVVMSNIAVGGLRISSITEIDNQGTALTRQFDYSIPGTGMSSGQHFLKDFIYNKTMVEIFIAPTYGGSIIGNSYLNSVLFSTHDLNGVANGYSFVKVVNPDESSELYQYNNFNVFPDEHYIVNGTSGVSQTINSTRQFGYPTSYSHRRGVLKSMKYFDSAESLIYEIEYKYPATPIEERKARGISISAVRRFPAMGSTEWLQTIYYHIKDNYQLIGEIEKTYDPQNSSNVLVKEKNYTYSADGTLLMESTENTSAGTINTTKYYYPINRDLMHDLSTEDYNAYGKLGDISNPVREETIFASGNKEITHTSYKIVDLGLQRVFPVKSSHAKNGNALQVDKQYWHDFNTGNLVSEQSRQGIIKSMLYDSSNEIVASITNASTGEVYYQGFEDAPEGVEGAAHTGIKYYNSPNYVISYIKPNQRKYKLSYYRLVNGEWEYVQTDFLTDNLVLQEANPVDDILVYPEDALVTTYTHIPLVGMTSKIEPNNQVTFYEYDELQRLKVVRDGARNILNRYEYKPACDCPLPVVYVRIEQRNVAVSETTDYYRVEADIYISLVNQLGTPLQGDGLNISVREIVDTDGQIQESDQAYPVSGTEYFIGRKAVFENIYFPYSTSTRDYLVLPGTGYIVW